MTTFEGDTNFTVLSLGLAENFTLSVQTQTNHYQESDARANMQNDETATTAATGKRTWVVLSLANATPDGMSPSNHIFKPTPWLTEA